MKSKNYACAEFGVTLCCYVCARGQRTDKVKRFRFSLAMITAKS
jgi:hypothetical protein